MTDDRREWFLGALKRELRCGPVRRRRVMREIRAHLDDSVTDLRAGGMAETPAVEEALRRLGDIDTITAAFRAARSQRRRRPRVGRLRSPAWVAVGVMSLVTGWAAEVPQASGAKATPQARSALHSGQVTKSRDHRRLGADDGSVPVRSHRLGRP